MNMGRPTPNRQVEGPGGSLYLEAGAISVLPSLACSFMCETQYLLIGYHLLWKQAFWYGRGMSLPTHGLLGTEASRHSPRILALDQVTVYGHWRGESN